MEPHNSIGNVEEPERNPTIEVSLERITDKSDYRFDAFCKVYREAFGGAPYFETFKDEYLKGLWENHIDCIMIIASVNASLVGFGCAHPALSDLEPEIKDFMIAHAKELDIPLETTVYMSELGVSTSARRNGIGKKLILERMLQAEQQGFTHYSLRTAANGSNSFRLYMSLGAKVIEAIHDVSHSEIKSASKERVYLCGSLSTALRKASS